MNDPLLLVKQINNIVTQLPSTLKGSTVSWGTPDRDLTPIGIGVGTTLPQWSFKATYPESSEHASARISEYETRSRSFCTIADACNTAFSCCAWPKDHSRQPQCFKQPINAAR